MSPYVLPAPMMYCSQWIYLPWDVPRLERLQSLTPAVRLVREYSADVQYIQITKNLRLALSAGASTSHALDDRTDGGLAQMCKPRQQLASCESCALRACLCDAALATKGPAARAACTVCSASPRHACDLCSMHSALVLKVLFSRTHFARPIHSS
ncbi:hypothetical protein FB451DRAFT_1207138 [Mycena latifolia]|nr:hypothetical protein FB451DRAFT_1207138 [Mycena latifolia]